MRSSQNRRMLVVTEEEADPVKELSIRIWQRCCLLFARLLCCWLSECGPSRWRGEGDATLHLNVSRGRLAKGCTPENIGRM
ncbi:hypothetical protein F2P81_013379 [Scophthalmus maximus]|uniref:Uncharacterized protein n=1 Tax=Scophthalmus maximus TaxID=52904 RepID=A0A6A4SGP9_SCOMX|nr:hypothetical protein F2P81_013379 [Scophthalmus maximus]